MSRDASPQTNRRDGSNIAGRGTKRNPATMTQLAHRLPPAAHLRLISMSNDEPRNTPTITVPPPSDVEPATNPHASEPGVDTSATMLPADGRTPSDFKQVAANDVIAAQRQLQASLDQLLGPGGRLEQQTAAISAVVDNAAKRQMQSYDLLRQDMMRRFDLVDARDKNQDAQLAAVTSELATLTGRIEVIERAGVAPGFQSDLRDVKDSVAMLIDAVAKMGVVSGDELAGCRVLLVDDHDLIRKSLTRVLSSFGAAVLTASTLAAVKVMMDFDPDCVLVDVRLAGGEDGTAIAKWLLGEAGFAPARVLLLTGDDGPGPAAAAAKLGVQLLGKPPKQDDLVRVIREASVSRPS